MMDTFASIDKVACAIREIQGREFWIFRKSKDYSRVSDKFG